MSKKKRRKPRSPGKPLWYKLDPRDKRQIILKNGTRLRQPIVELGFYLSMGGRIYSLTRFGLREIHVNYWKKNTYGKKTRNGNHQGQNYPFVSKNGRFYRLHVLMAMAWKGGVPEGMVVDHINGDIDDFRYVNIRVVDEVENYRCGSILKRLRKASVARFDPSLDPLNISQDDLLEIFKYCEGRQIDEALIEAIRRYGLVLVLRKASKDLHDPSINPDNMTPERKEEILSHYRVEDPGKIMEDDLKYHREF